MRGAAVAQRRPYEQVDEHADRDADPDVEQPRGQHPAVIGVAGCEHDDRGRGGRGRLAAQAAHGAGDEADQHGDAERHGADPEDVPGREGHEDADDRRRHLLRAVRSVPKTVAWTVSSAAHGARNGWATSSRECAIIQARAAASAVLASWSALVQSIGSRRRSMSGHYPPRPLRQTPGGGNTCVAPGTPSSTTNDATVSPADVGVATVTCGSRPATSPVSRRR